jgi:AcrR family transcriptional regulator
VPTSAVARRSKGADRESAVIAAAVELIAEEGLANLRVSDVAKRAGMTVGHVTYYFPSKNALLIRAIRHSEMEFHRDVERRLARRADPWSRLRSLIEAASANGPNDPGWVLWFEVWSMAVNDPEVSAVQQELAAWWSDTLADTVRYGVERDVFHPVDEAQMVAVLSALTNGLSVQLSLGDERLTAKRAVQLVMDTAARLL